MAIRYYRRMRLLYSGKCLRMASLQSFRGLIFVDGGSWSTLPTFTHSLCLLHMGKAQAAKKNRRKHRENRAVFEGEMAHKSHTIESMVRGYHVYGEIWLAAVGEELSCMSEVKNSRNLFAVAVMKSGVVGHVPRKISSVCSMFLRWGGTVDCRVTGGRCFSGDLPQGGLEIPCMLTLQGALGDMTSLRGC